MTVDADSLELRAILRLRNNKMLEARQRTGLSQLALAQEAGVPIDCVGRMERLDFSFVLPIERVNQVAAVLKLEPQEIMPDRLAGDIIPTTFIRIAEMSLDRLLDYDERERERLTLPSPADVAEQTELRERLNELLKTLTYREREVIRMRHGLTPDCTEYTWEELGRIFKVTRERVRQVYMKGIRKLQHPLRIEKLEDWAPMGLAGLRQGEKPLDVPAGKG